MIDSAQQVRVEQVDREAAADLIAWQRDLVPNRSKVPEQIRAGERDISGTVQAFARHRLAALASVAQPGTSHGNRNSLSADTVGARKGAAVPLADDVPDAAIEAAFYLIAGDKADPFMTPETWDHSRAVAAAVLASVPQPGAPWKQGDQALLAEMSGDARLSAEVRAMCQRLAAQPFPVQGAAQPSAVEAMREAAAKVADDTAAYNLQRCNELKDSDDPLDIERSVQWHIRYSQAASLAAAIRALPAAEGAQTGWATAVSVRPCQHQWGYMPTTGCMSCARCNEFRSWDDPETVRIRENYERATTPQSTIAKE